VVKGPKGTRRVAVEDVVTAPGKTSLVKGEVVESIRLPKRAAKMADAYLRFTPRTEMDIAVVSAAVNLTLGPKGVITQARAALGAVARTPVLVSEATTILKGGKLDEYRTQVAGVLAKRAAVLAYTRAGGKI